MSNIQNLFMQSREEWLASCRITARKLLRTRPSITIEDVLAVNPRPDWVHQNATGSVFQDRDFQSVGFTLARKQSSHGRVIRKWTLKGAAHAVPKRIRRYKEYDSD